MKNSGFLISVFVFILLVGSCKKEQNVYRIIKADVLKDKIAGGWAGKMIGVSYGGPTEFVAQCRIYEDPIKWKPSDTWESMWQDDIYVQLTFLMAMDTYGIDAPAKKYQEMLAKAGYKLWHANMQARKNYFDSIFPPASGSPGYNMHADCIDFQIEADYIGFICPGMPQTASGITEKIGRIMNYGDGLYGGKFIAALYSEAFFESDIEKIIEKALKSIPAESDYSTVIKDVIKLHRHYPSNWKDSWKELEGKWAEVDFCESGSTSNTDAKLNGAYIVMGLLYGDGDPMKTLEITTRCGQDSDCNPSNAMAVLGVIKGLSGLPQDLQDGVKSARDSIFINTTYSYTRAVNNTLAYALELISRNGGKIVDNEIIIKTQLPVEPKLEVSFPNVVLDKYESVFDQDNWKFTGKWKTFEVPSETENQFIKQSLYAEANGDELEIDFTGTGIALTGNWYRDGGKADVFVDGNLHRSIDTYYYDSGNEQKIESIWHVLNLPSGDHKIKLVVKGEKRPESEGTRVYVSSAKIFKNAQKKSDNYKFSFEK